MLQWIWFEKNDLLVLEREIFGKMIKRDVPVCFYHGFLRKTDLQIPLLRFVANDHCVTANYLPIFFVKKQLLLSYKCPLVGIFIAS